MSKIENQMTDVLIVGAGPSGLIAGLLLAELDISSIVIERNQFLDEAPKAHELNARSIEILRDIGLCDDELSVEASPNEDASRILFCRTINEEFGRIDLLADPDRKRKYDEHLRQDLPYLNLSQSELEKILVARAESSSHIDLRFGHQWDSFEEGDDSTISTVSGDCRYTVESKYLLACDGAASRVRKSVGIEMDGPIEIQSFVNAYFKMDLTDYVPNRAKLFWILHPQYAGTFVAHHMKKRWMYGIPVQKPYEQPEDFTEDVMLERIKGALNFDVPDLKIASITTWRMTAQVAQRYRKDRIILVGDAAHRFPPTGGLGLNSGFADAHNLCWKLARVLSGSALDSLLDTYETERKPVAERNCEESRKNYDKIYEVVETIGATRNGMAVLSRLMNSFLIRPLPKNVKKGFLRIITFIPLWIGGRSLKDGPARDRTQAAIANQIDHFDRLGLDIGYVYKEGALVRDPDEPEIPEAMVGEYIPRTSPGARLPHAWVETTEGRKSTHDFIAYDRFTLFVKTGQEANAETSSRDLVQAIDMSEWDGLPGDWHNSILVRPDGHVAWRGECWKPEYLAQIVDGQVAESTGVST